MYYNFGDPIAISHLLILVHDDFNVVFAYFFIQRTHNIKRIAIFLAMMRVYQQQRSNFLRYIKNQLFQNNYRFLWPMQCKHHLYKKYFSNSSTSPGPSTRTKKWRTMLQWQGGPTLVGSNVYENLWIAILDIYQSNLVATDVRLSLIHI